MDEFVRKVNVKSLKAHPLMNSLSIDLLQKTEILLLTMRSNKLLSLSSS